MEDAIHPLEEIIEDSGTGITTMYQSSGTGTGVLRVFKTVLTTVVDGNVTTTSKVMSMAKCKWSDRATATYDDDFIVKFSGHLLSK